ncbi:MAG: helix-turn-helix transcriptional regulator [Firmicutes bacterium]|nr:helix-turn-helix transcriptional regulator [Bacillota bacterium]
MVEYEEYKLKELDVREMGRRVRLRRELMELSRDQLAEKIDVSAQFIYDIEYGHKGMSIQTLYKLSQALEVSADYFLAGKVYASDDEEVVRFREEIRSTLDKCNAQQLKGVSQIVRIFEDGTRMK